MSSKLFMDVHILASQGYWVHFEHNGLSSLLAKMKCPQLFEIDMNDNIRISINWIFQHPYYMHLSLQKLFEYFSPSCARKQLYFLSGSILFVLLSFNSQYDKACSQKEIISQTDLYVVILSSKTYVFEDKLTMY